MTSERQSLSVKSREAERTGRIFEIREFTLHDGPGIRTTVFLKGCPLRCAWCHNPEGQSFDVEKLHHQDGRTTTCGEDWTPTALAKELLKNSDILNESGGGVTFSGGEPLAQADFVLDTIAAVRALDGGRMSFAVETSGYADSRTYEAVISQMNFVYQDLKLADPLAFRRWCGGDLEMVRRNVEFLKQSSIPHVFRVPCIPGVNDSEADRKIFQDWAADSTVEFLPYNPISAAKYSLLEGRKPFRFQT